MKVKAGGFTLVELLVASAILALIAVMGWRGLDTVVRAQRQLTAQLEQLRRTQLAFAQLEEDCASLADHAALGGRTILAGSDDRIVLVRVQKAEGQAEQLQVVRYRLQDGKLLRAVSEGTRELDRLELLWQRAISGAGTLQEATLQHAITSMAIRAWNREARVWRSGANVAYDAPPGRPRTQPLEEGLQVTLGSAGGPTQKVFMLGRR